MGQTGADLEGEGGGGLGGQNRAPSDTGNSAASYCCACRKMQSEGRSSLETSLVHTSL